MGAKSSESCLIKVQCVFGANEAILVSKFELQFSLFRAKINISKLKLMS